MATINIEGNSISYESRGEAQDKPPLVLVHGFPHDSRIWDAQLHELAKHLRVIVLDLPGFGQSKKAGEFTLSSLAETVHAFLAKLDALRCVLGGLSMGGYIALAFSKKFASDLAGLILCDTRAEADSTEAREGREKLIELAKTKGTNAVAKQMLPKQLSPETFKANPDVAEKLLQIMQGCPVETIVNALAAMRDRNDHSDHLASIAVPTLILVGEDDEPTPPKLAETMAKSIRNSTLVKIPKAGHLSPMEQPAIANQALEDFLRKVE